eukprot:scaffold3731_cov381-Prasinococcus_capsulatus_cf.AAC.4
MAPANLQALQGSDGNIKLFTIEDSSRGPFPRAHTCFNRIELPRYYLVQQGLVPVACLSHGTTEIPLFGAPDTRVKCVDYPGRAYWAIEQLLNSARPRMSVYNLEGLACIKQLEAARVPPALL